MRVLAAQDEAAADPHVPSAYFSHLTQINIAADFFRIYFPAAISPFNGVRQGLGNRRKPPISHRIGGSPADLSQFFYLLPLPQSSRPLALIPPSTP